MSESLEQPVVSEKKTVELCTEQVRRGVRCVLPRNHDGEHEYHDRQGVRVITGLAR